MSGWSRHTGDPGRAAFSSTGERAHCSRGSASAYLLLGHRTAMPRLFQTGRDVRVVGAEGFFPDWRAPVGSRGSASAYLPCVLRQSWRGCSESPATSGWSGPRGFLPDGERTRLYSGFGCRVLALVVRTGWPRSFRLVPTSGWSVTEGLLGEWRARAWSRGSASACMPWATYRAARSVRLFATSWMARDRGRSLVDSERALVQRFELPRTCPRFCSKGEPDCSGL